MKIYRLHLGHFYNRMMKCPVNFLIEEENSFYENIHLTVISFRGDFLSLMSYIK